MMRSAAQLVVPSARRRGFTLIELLVVVAVIALLMSILLPSLDCAREQARRVVCGSTLNTFGKGLGFYTNENSDFFPGINTSGVRLRQHYILQSGLIEEVTNADAPVQTYDWITPLIGQFDELPAKRADRWAFFWQERYACPNVSKTTSVLYQPGGLGAERNDFQEYAWKQNSYLMGIYFQFWGDGTQRVELAKHAPPLNTLSITPVRKPANWSEVRLPERYRSRINEVGAASRKLFASDGTRYLPGGDVPLDHDADIIPSIFGAFTEAGAWRAGATAFGVARGTQTWDGRQVGGSSPSEGKNIPLSWRHGCETDTSGDATRNPGQMNALFFDGHVEVLNDRQSREPHLWFPAGTVIESAFSFMTFVERGDVIP